MTWDDGTSYYTLSTGVSFYAYGGCLGLTAYEGSLRGGWDDDVTWLHGTAPDEETRPFTAAERQEIAEAMIARWRAWAERDQTLQGEEAAG